VRFSSRGVCNAKSLVSNDIPIFMVGVLFNLHELRVSGDKEEETAVVEVEDGLLLSSVEDRKKFALTMAREEIINEDRAIASRLLKACGVVGNTEVDEVDRVGHLSPLIRVGDEEDTVAELVEWPRPKGSRVEYPTDAVAKEDTELEDVFKELEISRFKRVASKDDKIKRSQGKRRMTGKTLGSMEEKLLTPELNTSLKLARLNKMPDGLVDMVTVSSTVVLNIAKRKAIKRGDASRYVMSDSVDDSSKRKKVTSPTKLQVVLEESDKIAEGADLRPRFEVEASLLEEQCRAKAREKMVAVVDDEFK
ncbi:hypothetical protein GIB67_004747, partial [Kingdonia uniflora]